MKKIIIAGSRTFCDYIKLKETLNNLLKSESIIIICGGAKGADLLGKQYGIEKGFTIEEILPDWGNLNEKPCVVKYNKYGAYNAMAGHNRNQKMLNAILNNSDGGYVVAFWDGKSTGTKNMVDISVKSGIKVEVISI